jgi:hypothetical protein
MYINMVQKTSCYLLMTVYNSIGKHYFKWLIIIFAGP